MTTDSPSNPASWTDPTTLSVADALDLARGRVARLRDDGVKHYAERVDVVETLIEEVDRLQAEVERMRPWYPVPAMGHGSLTTDADGRRTAR